MTKAKKKWTRPELKPTARLADVTRDKMTVSLSVDDAAAGPVDYSNMGR